MIRVKRAYDPHEPTDGRRFLVDRLWPRGVTKEELAIDGWIKDVSPSDALRRWYGHSPNRWPEFWRRYRGELDGNPEAWQPLLAAASEGDVTLIYAAKDMERNNAIVLRDYLLERSQ
jgi:uncharacterized protein YeaO (DUF488 family)